MRTAVCVFVVFLIAVDEVFISISVIHSVVTSTSPLSSHPQTGYTRATGVTFGCRDEMWQFSTNGGEWRMTILQESDVMLMRAEGAPDDNS